MKLYILPPEPIRAFVAELGKEFTSPDFKALCTRINGCTKAPVWMPDLEHDVIVSVIGLYVDNIYRYMRADNCYSLMADLVSGDFAQRLCVPFPYVVPILDKGRHYLNPDDVYEAEGKMSELLQEYILHAYLRSRDTFGGLLLNLLVMMQSNIPSNAGDLYRFEFTANGSPIMVTYDPICDPAVPDASSHVYAAPAIAKYGQPAYA